MKSRAAAADRRHFDSRGHKGAAQRRERIAARLFTGVLYVCCLVFLLVLGGLAITLLWKSRLSLATFGPEFLWSSEWDPVHGRFGAAPFLYGTMVSSLLALLLAGSIGLLAGVFLAEFAPRRLGAALGAMIELLAAVPSIVYGLWGLFVLAPFVGGWLGPALQAAFGFLPIFQGPIYGVSMLTAALVLSVMIVPTIAAITRDLIAATPMRYREASLALGATRWETIAKVLIPEVRGGIFGACMLALGRALGETIATTMVIGNRPAIAASLLAPGYTVASVIANEFTEATSDLYLSALIELGLILLLISLLVVGIGRLMLRLVVR
ncbi:MAG TPA: phosphate ABC transporter permease subunit PstC [Stellaceae bacterium]|nr:phosphate ABC transporter permease subunit PstC [Stellaceae bacterium]